MSIQLIWKRLIPQSSTCVSIPISLLRPLAINAKSQIKIAKFCTETETPSQTPPDSGVITAFLISKCGMTEKDVSKVLKNNKGLLRKSSENLEGRLELLNECGLTTPAQIRRAVSRNPRVLFNISETDIQSRLSLLRFFLNKDDICKLVITASFILNYREDKVRSAILVLQRLGVEGEALSKLVISQPRLLTSTEKTVIESFKVAESLGFQKGSNIFRNALRGTFGMGIEKIDLKLRYLGLLGFSNKQISEISSRMPVILGLSDEKLKRNIDFLVKSGEFSLDDFVRYPILLAFSLEKWIIPRYRVLEALKNMKMLKTEKISPAMIANLSGKRFLQNYADRNSEISSALRDIYYAGKAGSVDN